MLEEEGGEEGEVVDTHSESSFEQQQVFNVYLDDKSHEKNNETFYTFKYNFEPDSMDKSRGSLDNLRGEKDGISLGFPNSSTAGEEHLFKGIQTPCKDTDYVLTFDKERNGYILRKINNSINFRYVRQSKKQAPITNLEDKTAAPAKLGVMTMPKKKQQQQKTEINPINMESSNPLEDEELSELESIVLNDMNNSSK